jgi:hypothetical protein
MIGSPRHGVTKPRQVSLCNANFQGLSRRHGGDGWGVDNGDAGTLAARAGPAESGAGYAIGDAASSYLGGRGL